MNVLVARDVKVKVVVVFAPPVAVSVVMSVVYSVGVVTISVDVVMNSVTVEVIDAGVDKGASRPRFALGIPQRTELEIGASRPRLTLTDGIQLRVVVMILVATFVDVELVVMVVGFADAVVVPAWPT